MPIKGTIKAFYEEEIIANTLVGEKYFVPVDDIIVTEKAIFLDSLCGLALAELEEDDEIENYAILTRIGEGFTGKDFILDFSQTDFFFNLESKKVYLELKKDPTFIAFEKPKIEIVDDPLNEEEDNGNQAILVNSTENEMSLDFQNLESKKLVDLEKIQDELTDTMLQLRRSDPNENEPDDKRQEKMKKTEKLLIRVNAIIEEKQKK